MATIDRDTLECAVLAAIAITAARTDRGRAARRALYDRLGQASASALIENIEDALPEAEAESEVKPQP